MTWDNTNYVVGGDDSQKAVLMLKSNKLINFIHPDKIETPSGQEAAKVLNTLKDILG